MLRFLKGSLVVSAFGVIAYRYFLSRQVSSSLSLLKYSLAEYFTLAVPAAFDLIYETSGIQNTRVAIKENSNQQIDFRIKIRLIMDVSGFISNKLR